MPLTFHQAWGVSPLEISQRPSRVVSLVPSVTETLIQWGVMPVGRSSFCIEPQAKVADIQRVGGTKTPNLKRIAALKPDLVIANLEENQKADIQALQHMNIPVWITYPEDMPSTLHYLQELRQLCATDCTQADADLNEFAQLVEASSDPKPRGTMGILIWQEPWMAVGHETYTHHLMQAAGWSNAIPAPRYPTYTQAQLLETPMDVLLLPSEPYAFTSEHQAQWQQNLQQAGQHTTVHLFHGENLFWSGPRAKVAIDALQALF
jgi:ABC-type Fe3+-hydroxamate transport system substrate-binding protein